MDVDTFSTVKRVSWQVLTSDFKDYTENGSYQTEIDTATCSNTTEVISQKVKQYVPPPSELDDFMFRGPQLLLFFASHYDICQDRLSDPSQHQVSAYITSNHKYM